MKSKQFSLALWILLAIPSQWVRADQIILKDGKEYSGKFIRGDASVIEFRVLGRIEAFKTTDVSQIIFKEPELQPRQEGRMSTSSGPRDAQPARQVPPSPMPAPSVTFPEGSPLTIRTTAEIDTDRNRVGDTFSATLEDPLVMGSQVIVPRGAEVKGYITESKESGRIAGKSVLVLELAELVANGRTVVLKTGDYSEVGSSRGAKTAKTVGTTSAIGAIIGAIAGGGKGAAIGAAAGAATGAGIQILTRGETLKIPAETILEFKLQSPLTVTIP